MKCLKCRSISLLILGLVFGAQPLPCDGQGTLSITFEGPPYQPADAVSLVQSYSESGMWFGPMGSVGFLRNGGGVIPGTGGGYPSNGTAYIAAGTASKMSFGFDDESTFGLVSVDLARYFVGYPEMNITFVGYFAEGITPVTTTISVNLPSDPTFHTWSFGPEWSSGLTRVEIPSNPWSMDNQVVIVPEPASGTLLLMGGLALLAFKRRRRSQP